MFNLTRDEFIKHIQTARLKIAHKDTEIDIEPVFDYSFDEYPPVARFVGYGVNENSFDNIESSLDDIEDLFDENSLDDIESLLYENLFDSIEKLLAFLGNPTEFTVVSINDYARLEDYLLNEELKVATMEFIINRFEKCDKFSLVKGFEPDFHMSNAQASAIYNELIESDNAHLKKIYEEFKDEYNLDSFETIKSNITNECKAFKSKYFKKYNREGGFFNHYISDHVGDDTKYSEPYALFTDFYLMYGNHIDVKEELDKLVLVEENNKIMEQLDSYPALKNNFLDYKITYKTYVNEGPLSIIYYFKLNEETKQFLLKFKDDYSMDIPFEDLALYQDDKLVYASCTHEQFRYHKLTNIEE